MTTPATPPAAGASAPAVRLFAKLDGVRVTSLPEFTPTAIEALTLHRLGFNVFPMPFAQKAGYPWKAVQYVRLAEDDIPALFRYRANLAVMVGRTSGNLFVIDCETPAEFERQRATLRSIGVTAWAVRTGGGGGHLYLRSADGELANLTLTKAQSLGLGDCEVRGCRCYVLAPPSVHPDTGVFYEWLARDGDGPPVVPLAALDWLPLALAAARGTAGAPHQQTQEPGESVASASYAETAFAEEVERVASAPEGTRNDTLNRAAFALGQLVAVGALDENEVWDALFDAALDAGLSKGETARTIDSGLTAGMAKPRGNVPQRPRTATADQLRAWVSAQTWHGKAGASRRAVALALAERARTARNGTWRASEREVATLARVARDTVTRALKYLQEVGAIARAGEDATSSAALWKLGATVGCSDSDSEAANSPVTAECAVTGSAPCAGVVTGSAPVHSGAPSDSATADNNDGVIRAFAPATAADSAKNSAAAARENLPSACSLSQHTGALAPVSDAPTQSDIVGPLSPMESNSGPVMSLLPGTDAAERGALGKNGYLVYRALLALDAPRPSELAAATGLTVRQVRYALGVLREVSDGCGVTLVERLPSGAWLANPVNDEWLDRTVAVACGTAGAGEARRARFERERQGRAAAAFAEAIARQRRRDGHTP